MFAPGEDRSGHCPPPRSSAAPILFGPIEPPKRSEHAVFAQFRFGVFARGATEPLPLSGQVSRR
jgi:hypothetical protein